MGEILALGNELGLSVTLGQAFTSDVAKFDGVDKVTSYFNVTDPAEKAAMKSTDGQAVYVFVDLKDDVIQSQVVKKIQDEYGSTYNDASLHLAGMVAITSEINQSVAADLTAVETFAVPVLIILLVFVFGSLVAAGLPLLVGGIGIVGAFFFLWLAAQFTDTSVFAVNMVTGMGLGLGIDYALLIVTRYREALREHDDVAAAAGEALATAGHAVVFAGVTVMISLLGMLLMGMSFLNGLAFGSATANELASCPVADCQAASVVFCTP